MKQLVRALTFSTAILLVSCVNNGGGSSESGNPVSGVESPDIPLSPHGRPQDPIEKLIPDPSEPPIDYALLPPEETEVLPPEETEVPFVETILPVSPSHVASGPRLWMDIFSSGQASGQSMARDITIGSAGQVFLIGDTTRALDNVPLIGTRSMYLKKYNSKGERLWTKLIGIPNAEFHGFKIAKSSAGLFAVGYAYKPSRQLVGSTLDGQLVNGKTGDSFLFKIDPSNGNRIWTKVLSDTALASTHFSYAMVTALTADKDGGLFVTGKTWVPGPVVANANGTSTYYSEHEVAFLTKYDSNGNRLWNKHIGGHSSTTAGGMVSSDGSGGVYICGNTNQEIDGVALPANAVTSYYGAQNIFISRYNSSGVRLWTQFVSGDLGAGAILSDAAGNLYVAGRTDHDLHGVSKIGASSTFLVKYAPNGQRLWTKIYDFSMLVQALAIDSDGDIHAALKVAGNAGAYTGKFSSVDGSFSHMRLVSEGVNGWTSLAAFGIAVNDNAIYTSLGWIAPGISKGGVEVISK